MATIGGLACSFVRGDVPPLKGRLDVWQTPGVSGYGAHYLGAGDAGFRVSAILYSSAAGVAAWAALIQAMQGTIVSIVNDWGTTYANCLITRVGPLARSIAAGAGGARGELVVEGVRTA